MNGFLTALLPVFCFSAGVAQAAPLVRVLVWDEQQSQQKAAYGEKFLGETIAEYLGKQEGLSVTSVGLADSEQGLGDGALDAADVLVFWCHRRIKEQDDARAEAVVRRVLEGRLALVALHSAHWAKPFVRLMQERAKSDALFQIPVAERAGAKVEYLNDSPFYKGVKQDTPLTPSFTREGEGWKLVLPQCVFPSWRADGLPSHVSTLLPSHPIAAGLPVQWDIPQTEMYGEPFHVPAPDEVVFEEKWDKGEFFRSGCVWRVGKGRVFYFRPGHETYPVFKQSEPLRVVENAVRWLGVK